MLEQKKVSIIVRLGGNKDYENEKNPGIVIVSCDNDWPDHGIPSEKVFKELFERYTSALQEVRKKTNERPNVFVHCRAGVGRSGTFVAFDYISYLLSQNPKEKISIVEVIKQLRYYRTTFVQVHEQLEFLHKLFFFSDNIKENSDSFAAAGRKYIESK